MINRLKHIPLLLIVISNIGSTKYIQTPKAHYTASHIGGVDYIYGDDGSAGYGYSIGNTYYFNDL